MDGGIIGRIRRESSSGDIFNTLSDKISFSDLQSLLMEVYRKKIMRLDYSDILSQYEKNRFVKPSGASLKKLIEIDAAAFSMLPPDCEILDLSPVSPAGCCSVLGPVSQNNILTTIRNTEVCSDTTNVLALECALRRKEMMKRDRQSDKKIKLCASQRVIRAQPFKSPNSFAHFRLFAMCTSGRDTGGMRFEQEAACEHIRFYLSLVEKLISIGYKFKSIKLELIAYRQESANALKTVKDLLEGDPCAVPIFISTVENYSQHYYIDLGFHLFGVNSAGEDIFLVDGGLTDWTLKLLGNKKERLMISGMGTERLAHCFM